MTELIPSHLSAPAPDTTHRCEQCGCSPARQMTFRGHRGMIVVMQFLKERGVYCRTCGLALFRTMTSRTIAQGWWGYGSFLITPFVLLYNLVGRLKLRKLGEPVPALDGSSTAPANPGRPVFLRATMLVPIALVAFVTTVAVLADPANRIGQCVVSQGADDVGFVDCSQPNEGVVLSVVDDKDQCPAAAVGYVEEYTEYRSGGRTVDNVYCLGD